jgi:hypothetical protein
MTTIEVGQWYRRGDYRFVKVMEINGDEVEGFTITIDRTYGSESRSLQEWDLGILEEHFVPTNEKTILMLINNEHLEM